MHFVDRELNERLAIFGSGQYKSIIGDDSPPCYSLDELDARMFKTLTRFNVKVDEVTYECALTPSLQKEMYVFLSGAQIRQGLRAAFNRISWHQYFHGVCICIEDPTYKVEKVNNLWGGTLVLHKSFM